MRAPLKFKAYLRRNHVYVGVVVALERRGQGKRFGSVHRAVQDKDIRVRQIERHVAYFIAYAAACPDSVGARNARSAVFCAVDGAFVVGRAYADGEVFDFLGKPRATREESSQFSGMLTVPAVLPSIVTFSNADQRV